MSLTTLAALCALCALAAPAQPPSIQVKAEEEVYTLVPPENGSGPLWSYGCTQIVRLGDQVFLSQMETGAGVPLLANTRWRLLRRTERRGAEGGWMLQAEPDAYRQREPCSLATTSNSDLFMYVNDSLDPPGTKYGHAEPNVIHFTVEGNEVRQQKLSPQWDGAPNYTDHSYRGFAADRDHAQLLMLNIDAKTSIQHACLLSTDGKTLANAAVQFPIRACYPQVALRNSAAHILAVGDIVEPVKEWRDYKFEQTKSGWDYVFRILYYTWTPDLTKQGFAPPIEIANVDETGGYISNQDLWISPDGEAYLLYSQREVQSALLRDKFFSGKSIISSLYLAIIKDGAVVSRRTLIAGTDTIEPGCARFHAVSNKELYAVLYVTGPEAGNKLMAIYPPVENPPLIPIPLKKPLSGFCLASVRAGNAPSTIIDLHGCVSGNTYSYAQISIESPTAKLTP